MSFPREGNSSSILEQIIHHQLFLRRLKFLNTLMFLNGFCTFEVFFSKLLKINLSFVLFALKAHENIFYSLLNYICLLE